MIPKNVGPTDRAIRPLAGLVLLPAGLWLLDALHGSAAGLVVAILSAVGLLTGATGRCLLYVPLGINSAKGTKRTGTAAARQRP